MIYAISFAVAFSFGLIGYGFIYCIEHNVKLFTDILDKMRITKKNLYMFTSFNLIYFGVGCVLMYFDLLKF